MKILTVVGARPQFIKSVPVSKALRRVGLQEILVHTGQHYDYDMSQVFFEELAMSPPDENLGIGSGPQGWQTGHMLIRLEESMEKYKPDHVLVYGDTNSTLAGALAAAKLHISVSHVEAGLRSFNQKMPEEHNRVLTDHISNLLFVPTETAVKNLHNEGIDPQSIHLVGDVMADALLYYSSIASDRSNILSRLDLNPGKYMVATVHRAENTENLNLLQNIFQGLANVSKLGPVIVPLHPRTRQYLEMIIMNPDKGIRIINPVGYLDMLKLVQSARMVLTDSGGLQKEAYCLGTPCITLRGETEWVETVESGWNVVAGTDPDKILKAAAGFNPPFSRPNLYGDGNSAVKIASILLCYKAPENGSVKPF